MLKRLILIAANILERPFLKDEKIGGRFKIIELLGTGSYGNSYLVFDEISQQNKVLKALRVHKRITESGRNGFEYEKELLNSIQHPGFPSFFEEGIHKNVPFFTMEYIEGKNFEQLIFQEDKKYSETHAFMIASELLDLIHYLHSQQIVHRDIRIPNVISTGSHIRLIDLGLARKMSPLDEYPDKKKWDLRKEIRPQADFYGLGHFLLFLLYSNYSFPANQKEGSWEEELDISYEAKHIIKRLLQINAPYESSTEIQIDIQTIINP